ncbi:MAG: 6-carboxytetrahydropterin synthase [Burkholderiaceae bacterium]
MTVPRRYELRQSFFFDAAHTLQRRIEADASRRIHGHTYHVDVCVSGPKDPASGMVVDLGFVRAAIARLRDRLDHRLLDEVDGLGPPTLENLCAFIWAELDPEVARLSAVTVRREGIGDGCTLRRDAA